MSTTLGRETRRKAGVRGLASMVVLALACGRGGAQTKTPGVTDPLPLDQQVVFEVDAIAKKVRVDPPVFLQRVGGGVEFKATGLAEGYTLEIDFKVQEGTRGPFAKGASLARGRYSLTAKTPSWPSGPSSYPGAWKYDVVLRDAKGDDVVAIDPVGVFR